MAILTSSSRGSSATTTGSTWASTTNAYDGTFGTNTNTYATLTGAASGTTSTLTVSGYGFSSIPAYTVVNFITVTIRGLVTTANRWSNPTVQAYLGSTPLGTATATATALTTTVASYSITLTGVTMDQVRDSTFGIRLNLIRSGGSTDSASVDFIDTTVDYGFENWGSFTLNA